MQAGSRHWAVDRSGFGRIPFALVAVAVLLTSTLLAGTVYDITMDRFNRDIENTFALIEAAGDEGANRFESSAVSALNEILIDLSSTRELRERSLNDRLHEHFNESIPQIFPILNEAYTVEMMDHRLLVIEDRMTAGSGEVPAYLRLMGSAELSVRLTGCENTRASRHAVFDRKIMVPLPLMINSVEVLKASTDGSGSDLADLVRYILTALVQMRVLAGEGVGAGNDKALMSGTDVENALDLALVMEQARVFRAYDAGSTGPLDGKNILDNYLRAGELDGADLYMLLENMDEQKIDLGRMISESIMVYADWFIYRLLEIFWPDDTPDAVLQEPLTDYTALKELGEEYAKEKLIEYLDVVRQWLMLPPLLVSHYGTAEIPDITRHAVSVDEASKPPVPLPVSGDYELFSMPFGARWFAAAGAGSADPAGWPPVQITIDPVDLIFGEAANHRFMPKPYKISMFSTFGLPVTVSYRMVNRSFIAHFADNESSTPYYDTLKIILEIINSSITTKAVGRPVKNDTAPGMLDHITADAEKLVDAMKPAVAWADLTEACADPADSRPVLPAAANALMDEHIAPVLDALRSTARTQELASGIPGAGTWFEDGLLKKDRGNNGLYHLVRTTVDLYYELYLTLYRSSTAEPGKLDGSWAWNFPWIYFAPLDSDQKKSDSNDSFNFPRDAVKHAYNSVWTVVLQHLAGSSGYFHPDAYNAGKFECAEPPIPEVAWLLYGWDKYPWDPGCSNLRLWDDVIKAVEPGLRTAFGSPLGIGFEANAGLKILNLSTDSRAYGKNFHEFLWFSFGMNMLGPSSYSPESILEAMISEDGWLEKMLLEKMYSDLAGYMDHRNLKVTTNCLAGSPFVFSEFRSSVQGNRHYVFHEQFNVDQTLLSCAEKNRFGISITEPVHEPRFVSVQEEGSTPADTAFCTSWDVRARFDVRITITTGRHCLLGEEDSIPFDLDEDLSVELAFPVVAVSGWPLGGRKYPMTNSIINATDGSYLSIDRPSAKILALLDAQTEIEKDLLDRLELLDGIVSRSPLGFTHMHPNFIRSYDVLKQECEQLLEPPEQGPVDRLRSSSGDMRYNLHGAEGYEIRHRGLLVEHILSPFAKMRSSFNLSGTELSSIQCEAGDDGIKLNLKRVDGYIEAQMLLIGSLYTNLFDIDISVITPRAGLRISCADDPTHPDPNAVMLSELKDPVGIISSSVSLRPRELHTEYSAQELYKAPPPAVYSIKEASIMNAGGLFELELYLKNVSGYSDFGSGAVLSYFHDDAAAGWRSIEFEFENTRDPETLAKHLKIFRSAQYELLHEMAFGGGDRPMELPAVICLGTNDIVLDRYRLNIIYGERSSYDLTKNLWIMTADRMYGPGEILRYGLTGSAEELYLRTDLNNNDWARVSYSF